MKKTICMLLAALMVLSLAACGSSNSGKQTASAYLDQSENTALEVTVDLSGGWSVEFVRGAVYLYDGEIVEGKDGVAMLITLDKEVYDEDLARAAADAGRKEADGGIYYTDDNWAAFLASPNGTAYILITAANQKTLEDIVARFSFSVG